MKGASDGLIDDRRLAEIREIVTRWISEPDAVCPGHVTCVRTIPATPDDVFWLCDQVERLAKALRTADHAYSEAIDDIGHELVATQERALDAERQIAEQERPKGGLTREQVERYMDD